MRLLFITSNRIGDAVLTTGVLGHLVENYPGARITVACGPLAADLFRAVPGLERVIQMRKKKWNGHWLDLWQACVGTRWDMIVDFRNSVVSRLLWSKERAYGPAHATGRHKVADNAMAFHLDPPPSPRLWFDWRAEANAAAVLGKHRNVIAFAPAANWPVKQWPVEKFAQLASRLTDVKGAFPKARIMVAAAPHERPQLAPLFEAFPRGSLIDCIGEDLLTVAACIRRCQMFIGNDSGLMHIAAATGTPTLGLFGPGFEAMYGPWGETCAYVRTPESAAELLARLPHPGATSPHLMENLSVDAVVKAVEKLKFSIPRLRRSNCG